MQTKPRPTQAPPPKHPIRKSRSYQTIVPQPSAPTNVSAPARSRLALTRKQLLVGGIILATIGSLLDPKMFPAFGRRPATEECLSPIQSEVRLSRYQLAQLLTIPEGGSRQRAQAVLPKPYCHLAKLQIQAGAAADRVVYPLEADPKTWLIVLYENDRYLGYRFLPR